MGAAFKPSYTKPLPAGGGDALPAHFLTDTRKNKSDVMRATGTTDGGQLRACINAFTSLRSNGIFRGIYCQIDRR